MKAWNDFSLRQAGFAHPVYACGLSSFCLDLLRKNRRQKPYLRAGSGLLFFEQQTLLSSLLQLCLEQTPGQSVQSLAQSWQMRWNIHPRPEKLQDILRRSGFYQQGNRWYVNAASCFESQEARLEQEAQRLQEEGLWQLCCKKRPVQSETAGLPCTEGRLLRYMSDDKNADMMQKRRFPGKSGVSAVKTLLLSSGGKRCRKERTRLHGFLTCAGQEGAGLLFLRDIPGVVSGPVDAGYTVAFQKLVGLNKMAVAKEAPVGGQGRGMGGFQHQMVRIGDEPLCLAGLGAPEQEHHGLVLPVQFPEHRIGELLPAQVLMGQGLMGPDGENGIEQQHALPGPVCEIAGAVHGLLQFIGQFRIHIGQGRRDFSVSGTEKANPWAWLGPWYGSCPRMTTFT